MPETQLGMKIVAVTVNHQHLGRFLIYTVNQNDFLRNLQKLEDSVRLIGLSIEFEVKVSSINLTNDDLKNLEYTEALQEDWLENQHIDLSFDILKDGILKFDYLRLLPASNFNRSHLNVLLSESKANVTIIGNYRYIDKYLRGKTLVYQTLLAYANLDLTSTETSIVLTQALNNIIREDQHE